jgi:hypothetical protein
MVLERKEYAVQLGSFSKKNMWKLGIESSLKQAKYIEVWGLT